MTTHESPDTAAGGCLLAAGLLFMGSSTLTGLSAAVLIGGLAAVASTGEPEPEAVGIVLGLSILLYLLGRVS